MEDKKTEKKAFNKMLLFKIFILLGYVLTFFALLFVVSRCSRDVSADVPKYYEMTYNSSDVIDTNTGENVAIKLDFFDAYDLLYRENNVVIQRYSFTTPNSNVVLGTFNSSLHSSGIDLYFNYALNGVVQAQNHIGWFSNDILENSILAMGIRLYVNPLDNTTLRCEPVLYYLNTTAEGVNNSQWYNLESSRFTIPDTSCSILSRSLNQFWVTSRFATDLTLGDTTADYNKLLSLIHSTNAHNINVVYRNEYLFGDLVSSFLNISFGNVTLGGNTYTFTLGLLLLFILGLGALFLVLKVMLGG